MRIKYNTFFRNHYIEVETKITFGENNSKYISPMIINGIMVETDGFKELSIVKTKKYNQNQLQLFDYDIKYDLYILKNYYFKVNIPVNIINRDIKNMFSDDLIIEMENKNNKTIAKLKLLDKEIILSNYGILGSFEQLYKEVHQNYLINICVFCKKSCWNPFGGSEFINHLCFKEFAEEYYNCKQNTKWVILTLIAKNNGKYKEVYLTNSCDEYIEK